MKNLTDPHGHEVFILPEAPPAGAKPREPKSLRVTVPDNGEPWPVMIRNSDGIPVSGLWIAEADIMALAREITERRPGTLKVQEHQPSGYMHATEAAASYLAEGGLTVLDQGWCCDKGGLSVVADDNGVLVAVYLRFAVNGGWTRPLNQMNEQLVTFTRDLARLWWAEKRDGQPVPQIRIDVVGMNRREDGWQFHHVPGGAS